MSELPKPSMPVPPNLTPKERLAQALAELKTPSVPTPPKPPTDPYQPKSKVSQMVGSAEIHTKDGGRMEVDEETTESILNSTLKPIHAADPNILRFIQHYLTCRSIPQAAKLTGLSARDGRHLFNRKDIYLSIKRITDMAMEKYGYDAEEAVERVKEIAFLDPASFQKEDGSWIESIHDVPVEMRRAIKKMKVKNLYEEDPNGMKVVHGKIIEIEFYDKIKPLEMLGKEKEIFKEKTVIQHDVSKNMRDVLLASRDRAEIVAKDVSSSIPQIASYREVESSDE